MTDPFVKSHLAITRDQHEMNKHIHPEAYVKGGGLRQAFKRGSPFKGLKIVEVAPTYDTFKPLIDRVGGPWNWNRRPRYHADHRAEIEKLLRRDSARLFVFQKDERPIGYCLSAAPGEEPDVRRSLRAHGMGTDIIEIENFGFFPEHTKKKYGRFFLPKMFDELFKGNEKHPGHETVYLSTRSTNHGKVVPFYESLGMQTIRRETLPDDLLPAASPGVILTPVPASKVAKKTRGGGSGAPGGPGHGRLAFGNGR